MTLLVATAGFVIQRVYSDTCRVRISVSNLEVDSLPPHLDGLRIVHVSDLQADPRTNPNRQRQYVEALNSLDAGLVLFSGDLITSGTTHIDEGAESPGKMKARLGVYACLGDHDIWSDAGQVTASLRRNGIRTAHTGHFLLDVDGGELNLSMPLYVKNPRHRYRYCSLINLLRTS